MSLLKRDDIKNRLPTSIFLSGDMLVFGGVFLCWPATNHKCTPLKINMEPENGPILHFGGVEHFL